MSVSRRSFVAGCAAVCGGCSLFDDATNGGDAADQNSGEPPSPRVPRGFGSEIGLGRVEDVLQQIDEGDGLLYMPEARAWIVRYPPESLEAARGVYDDATIGGMEVGLVALYQKCTHLGCRVPECTTSGRFECPCHGAIFNGVGEYLDGPAPRGMDRFALTIRDGKISVDTSRIIEGAEKGVLTVEDLGDGVTCIQPAGS